MWVRAILMSMLWSIVTDAGFAQSTLPEGIYLFRYGQRVFLSPFYQYDSDGSRINRADAYSIDLKGAELLKGGAGESLKELAEELRNFDGQNPGKDSLLDKLDLGRVEVEADGKMAVHFFGLGYGIAKHLTAYAGLPYVEAEIEASMRYQATQNNAAAIKEELGDLAYEELQDGLDEAAGVDAGRIQSEIDSYGYEPLGVWSKKTIGDLRLGLQSEKKILLFDALKYNPVFQLELIVPTGYKDDPNILHDISVGQEYYSVEFLVEQNTHLSRSWTLSLLTSYQANMNAEVKRRVPEGDDFLVAADRLSSVKLDPGDDVNLAMTAQFRVSYFTFGYRAGIYRHYGDEYRGSLSGNYASLGENSDQFMIYNRLTASLSTVDAFLKGRFSVPLLLDLVAHRPGAGRNTMDDRYVQLTLSIPLGSPPKRRKPLKKVKPRKKRGSGKASKKA